MKQIWAKQLREEMNVCLVFGLNAKIEGKTELRLSSNVCFRLSADGEMIGYGPRRKAHGRAAVNVYDLSAYRGRTIRIEAELVSYRVTNFYIVDQPPFFAAELVSEGKVVADSFDFEAYRNLSKLQKVQRFSYQRGFIEAYKIDGERSLAPVETDEKEVCILEESCAPYPKFGVLPAEVFESGRIFEREDFTEYDDSYLNRRGTPHFPEEEQEYRITRENDRYGFEKAEGIGEELERSYRAYKLPRNAAGFIAFEAEVAEDADVMINYDEKLSPAAYRYCERFRSDPSSEDNLNVDKSVCLKNGASNIDVYRLHSISEINYKLTKGRYSLMAFEADEMQFIRIFVVSGKAKISDVRLVTYENEEVRAKFKSEDKELELMFEAAVNSFKPNAVDVLTDCPSRERAGWLCDSYFTGRAEKLLTGKNDVERNLLEAYLHCPAGSVDVPEAAFPMCYPSDHRANGRYIPNWCMWLILEIESYLKRSGDEELAAAFRDKVLAFTEYELKFANRDGLLENPEGWIFVEWSRANDLTGGVNYPTNMLFSAALKAVSRMYGVGRYASIAKKMDEKILAQSFNGRFFVDNAMRDENGKLALNTEWTEVCQYYAFYFGYADKAKNPELFRTMFEEICDYSDVSEKYPEMSRSDAFIGLYLRLDYLSRIKEYEKVVRDMKNYFLFQAEETKTYWEYKTPSGSCCHAFASLICEWILKAAFDFEEDAKGNVIPGKRRIGIKASAEIPCGDRVYRIKNF